VHLLRFGSRCIQALGDMRSGVFVYANLVCLSLSYSIIQHGWNLRFALTLFACGCSVYFLSV
jgi:hypothetical protein